MQKPLPAWAFGVLSIVGAVLVGSMVLNWVDLGGEFSQRGLSLAWSENHWLFLVPISGLALLAAAATRSSSTRSAAIVAGMVVAGYVLLNAAQSLVHSGVDTWLILGGAAAMLVGVPAQRAPWRAIGGLAVLAGFFAPWSSFSMFKILINMPVEAFGVRVLWLIPLAGLVGLAGAGNRTTGGKLALFGGLAVYGSLLWVIGSAAWQVFGLGAWAALGASTIALAIGVLASAGATAIAKIEPAKE